MNGGGARTMDPAKPTAGGEEPWDSARVERFFALLADEPSDETAAPPAATPHHQAAAVLAAFDPDTLTGWGGAPPPRGELLRRLLADATPVEGGNRAGLWSLAVGPRQDALRAFRSRRDLREALALNRREPHDPLQHLLDAYLSGLTPDAGAMDEATLSLAIQVVGWLQGVPADEPLALPDLDALRRRLDRLRFVNPIRALVGKHFRGRQAELDRIRAYLDGASPDSPGPLLISGVGGSGKSTLAARVALDLLTGEAPAPVVYLDFDRKLLAPDEPASLLLEAVRQLDLQMPAADPQADILARLLRDDLAAGRPSGGPGEALGVSVLLSGSTGSDRLARLADLVVAVPAWRDRPLLVVVDTFEQVQYRSREMVGLVWDFLGSLQDAVPRVRVLVAGRAMADAPTATVLQLAGLDEPAAVACLTALGVPAEAAPDVFRQVGGNPLVLRLAAEVVRQEPLPFLLDHLAGAALGDKLRDELVQGYLLRRVLGHIHDPDVRRLAHPGLVLRQVTPDLIRRVLAGPCDVQVPDQAAAERLWRELGRETSLVVQEAGAVLRHRPEVRREMIDLLRASKPAQAAAIHAAAVAYYAGFDDDASRAEELYHRLSLEQPREQLDARWRAGAAQWLRAAVDELPPSAMAYLASRAGAEGGDGEPGIEAVALGDDFWRQADLQLWERKTAVRVRDLMRLHRLAEALAALHERAARLPASPLSLLEGQVLQRLGHLDEANRVVAAALRRWPPGVAASERADLLLLQVALLEAAGRGDHALASAVEASRLLGATARPSQRLAAALAQARLAPPDAAPAALDRLAQVTATLADRDLAGTPDAAAAAAQALMDAHPEEAAHIFQVVGSTAAAPARRGGEKTAGERFGAQAASAARSAQADEIGALVRALAESFDLDEIRELVRLRLAIRLENVVPAAGPLKDVIFDLVDWADRQGRLQELIAAAQQERPGNEALARLAHGGATVPPPGALHLRGSQVDTLSRILAGAFPDVGTLLAVLAKRLNRSLATYRSRPLTVAQAARELVENANAEGWSGPLLAAMREARPGDSDIYRFVTEFGLAAMKPEDDRAVRGAFPRMNIDAWRARLAALDAQLCLVEVGRGSSAVHGTGLLVGPDLVLTAGAALGFGRSSNLQPERVSLRFDFKQLDNGTVLNSGKTFRLATKWLVAAGGATNLIIEEYVPFYTLLRVDGEPGNQPVGWPQAEADGVPRGWCRCIAAGSTPRPSTPLCMLYYAGPGPANFSFGRQAVVGESAHGSILRYRLAPERGASGAPLFDADLSLVAIHQGLQTEYREGILLSAILRDLRRQNVDVLGALDET